MSDKKKVKLSKEKLQFFLEKSELMVPHCFGGYDENDPVCKDWCARATEKDIYLKAEEIRSCFHELGFNSFFCNETRESCQEIRKSLEKKMRSAKRQIEELNAKRENRDRYYLAEDKGSLGRIPQGEVRWDEDFANFVGLMNLYLETADYSLFVHPYGPRYDDAVGKIYQVHAGGVGPFNTQLDLGYAKVIKPVLPEAWHYPIRVTKQTVTENGDLRLFTEIHHNKNYSSEIIDHHGVDGKKITIVLYGDSAKRFILVDDLGKL